MKLRPVLVLGVLIGLVDLYVMVRGVPDGNLAFVETRWPEPSPPRGGF